MGWFERMGLVEREYPGAEIPEDIPDEVDISIQEEDPVNADVESTENIVESIYDQNDLEDRSNSIYVVDSMIKTLPSEMTTVKKAATVLGNLNVFGRNVADLVEDGSHRVDVLKAAEEQIRKDNTDSIAEWNGQIESLKQEIESKTILIKNAEELIASSKDSIEAEVDNVLRLIDFCGKMTDQEGNR